MADTEERTMVDGSPETPDHRELRPDGQQKGYVVLSEAERAKGFVRPVRSSYRHVGVAVEHPTRPLTPEEEERYADQDYIAFEVYPESESPVTGRFLTAAQQRACGTVTTMAQALAETFARDPKFSGSTFCAGCRSHFPVGEFRWTGENENEVLGS